MNKILKKIKPRFSFHYVAYTILFIVIIFTTVTFVTATTPNPGHPWSELGDGVFTVANTQTVNRTYTFPDANATVLTTDAAVTVAQGGTGLSSIAAGSVLGYNTANTASVITSTTGTKVLTNTDGVITWGTASGGMTWPSGGAGIPNYSGSSSWGTSYTTTGSGTVLALATTPTFTTSITSPKIIGGTSATSSLTFQTTSGSGITDADMHFLVGDAGAQEAMTILNNGYVRVNQGLSFIGGAGQIYLDETTEIFHADSPGSKLLIGGSNGDPSVASTIVGSSAGSNLNYDSEGNTFLGASSGASVTSGDYNLLMGYSSGDALTTGSYNIAIGYDVDLPSNIGSSQLTIGNLIFGTGGFGTGTTVGSGNIGIAKVAPTARLHLGAGTATAGTAPLKLTAGTNLTTTEAGAIEFDGTHIYFTATNGGTRYQLDQQSGGSGIPYTGATSDINLGVNDLTVDTNTLFVDSTNHRVGIGMTNPSTNLDITGSMKISGTIGMGTNPDANYLLFMNKTFDGSASQAGLKQWVFSNPTADSANTLYGLSMSARKTGNFNQTQLMGIEALAANQGNGSIASASGVTANVALFGSGNAGTISNGYAFRAYPPARDSGHTGTISSSYGMLITNQGASFITNSYGLRIDNQSGSTSTNYSIYSVGGDNYFGGNIGIGRTTPTAALHLKAGTATANTAPIKLTAGTNLTTTEAGAIEFDGTHIYFTATNGGTRYQLDQQGGTGANSLGTYIVQTATNAPSNAQVLGSLSTGLVKNTTSTGVLSIATAGVDYQAPLVSGTNIKTINGNSILGSGDITISGGTSGLEHHKIIETKNRIPSQNVSYTGTVRNVPGTYATITDAYNASVDGDIIQLADGTYYLDNEAGGYLMLNTAGKGVLIRGNSANRSAVVLNHRANSYGIRMRDSGAMTFQDITFTGNLTYLITQDNGYGSIWTKFLNCTFTLSGATGSAFTRNSLSTDTRSVYTEFNNCIFNTTSSWQPITKTNSGINETLLIVKSTINVTNSSAIDYNSSNRGYFAIYDSTLNSTDDGATIFKMGEDESVPTHNTANFDIRNNTFSYTDVAAYGHAVLLGRGTSKVYFVNNTISAQPINNTLNLGLVIKTTGSSLGTSYIAGNRITSARPLYIKGGQNNILKYNLSVTNLSNWYAFEIVNPDSGRISTGNVMLNNIFIGGDTGMLAYTSSGYENGGVSMKSWNINNNKYFSNNDIFLRADSVNYTFANKNNFYNGNGNDEYSEEIDSSVVTLSATGIVDMNSVSSPEVLSGTPLLLTETGTTQSTNNLIGLTVNPASGGTFAGNVINIVMDAVDIGANTGNGLHIVVDQSQAIGMPILVEDDNGIDILSLSQTGGLTIGSATNRLDTTTYGDFIAQGSDIQTALTGIIDIKVYDTSRDSDGGEWRDSLLSSQLSWYSEAKDDGVNDSCVIATDDRCGSSEFPRKAIIVTTANGLYIFNATNNLLWMKFTQAGTYALGADTNNNPSGVDAQNGVIVIGTNGTSGSGMYAIDFKQDAMYRYNTTNRSQADKNIANRNTTVTYNLNTETNLAIIDNIVNDVSIAMQTSSNEGAGGTLIAPIDSQPGPVKGVTLIGIATDTGISVIHTGPREVFNYSDATGNDYNQIYVTSRGRMYATNEALAQLEEWRNIDKDFTSEVNGTPDAFFDETAGRPKISLNGVVPTISTSPNALTVIERGSSARESAAAGLIDSGDIVYVGTNQGLAEVHTSGGAIALAAWSKVTTKDVTTPYMVGPVRAAYLFNDSAGSTFALNGTSTSTTNRMQSPIVGTSPTFGQSGVRGNSVSFNNNSYLCSDSTTDGICDGNTIFNSTTVSFSVSLWFKHSTTAAADTLFERCYTPATPTVVQPCMYAGMTSTGAIRFGINTTATAWVYATTYTDNIVSTALYNDNQWHHALFTNTDTDTCLYIDGRQAAACDTSVAGTVSLDAAQVLTIGGSCAGANCTTGANFWDGSIDDFVWSSLGTTTSAGLTAQSANKLYLDGRAHLIRPVADVSDADIFSSTTIGKTGESYVPGSFVGLIVELDGGTGSGQTRTIISNDATTFTVYPAFTTPPDGTTDYKVNAGRLYGSTNNVTAISADLPTSLNKVRKIYVGTNDGADGGGISVFTNAGAGSLKTEVMHSDAGYHNDDYGSSWTGTGADNITAIGSYSDTAVFGNAAFFRSQRKDISLKQLQIDTIGALEDIKTELIAGGLFGSTQDVLGLGQGADLAEYYYSNTPLEAGDVVAIQPDQPAGIGKSNSRYQKNLLGVVSTRPGLTLGPVAENAYPIALGGRIPVKITNENGEIHVGDMLTSSSRPGYAMKATTAGSVLGKVINEPEEMISCDASMPDISSAIGDGPGVISGVDEIQSEDNSDSILKDEEDDNVDDSVKCGYAMLFVGLSDSLGSDVVKLAEEYATSKNNLLKEEDINGLTDIVVLDEPTEDESSVEVDEKRLVLDFLKAERESRLTNSFNLQSIYTDKLAAAVQVITPEVVTDDLYVGNVAEFSLPPLFNKDTAGFAVIKKGDRRVRIEFENQYIAEPAIGAMLVFNVADNITDALAGDIFENKVESMVVDSDQSGFTILINKNAPRDLRYAWNAFQVKDAKVFESVIEGLIIDMPEEDFDSEVEEEIVEDKEKVVTPVDNSTIDTILNIDENTPVVIEDDLVEDNIEETVIEGNIEIVEPDDLPKENLKAEPVIVEPVIKEEPVILETAPVDNPT